MGRWHLLYIRQRGAGAALHDDGVSGRRSQVQVARLRSVAVTSSMKAGVTACNRHAIRLSPTCDRASFHTPSLFSSGKHVACLRAVGCRFYNSSFVVPSGAFNPSIPGGILITSKIRRSVFGSTALDEVRSCTRIIALRFSYSIILLYSSLIIISSLPTN